MQDKQNTGLPTKARGYITICQQACNKVHGFKELYQQFDRFTNISGKSRSMFTNYSRQLAHIALYYNQLPTELDAEQVMEYLHRVKLKGTPSATFFKFTVYGMRAVCKLNGLSYRQFCLPSIEQSRKLPTVLNNTELKQLMKACRLLKHKLLIGLCYGCGLRCGEVRNLLVGDVDLERRMVHVRQGKGGKDRVLPLGYLLCRGLRKYLATEKPSTFLFTGNSGEALSQRGAQLIMSSAVKKAGILKIHVSLHTLRHTFATHLLEQGVSILTIKELLGHAHIYTTMIYLQLVRPAFTTKLCPLDALYRKTS